MAVPAPRRVYDTTLDRAGLALGAGALVGGVVAMLLVAVASGPSPLDLLLGLVLGMVVTAMAVVAVGGPVWIVALAGFGLFLCGQSYGFGLFAAPALDAETLTYRWISGVATSLFLALVSAVIALVMWRVAYRRSAAARLPQPRG